MKFRFLKLAISILGCITFISAAELRYSHSGILNLSTIHRLSDYSIIKIPYRVLTYESLVSTNNFNIIGSTAFEFRFGGIEKLETSQGKLNLRELYAEYFFDLGEVSLGKQIINWGSASENNPTDNVSPLNYYYLFSLGKERREGIFSLSSILYYQNMKMNLVYIPQTAAHIVPLDDPEFAINSPVSLRDDQIMKVSRPEYGFSFTVPYSIFEFNTSYFSGYDRIVSFFGANVWSNQAFTNPIVADTVFSYRKTDVVGLGASLLAGEFAVRGDIAYFNSGKKFSKEDIYRDYERGRKIIIDACEQRNANLPDWATSIDCTNDAEYKDTFLLDNIAKYYQYTVEFEYRPNIDFSLISQFSKHVSTEFGKADSLTLSAGTILLDPEALFIPGMGLPNSFISNSAMSISAIKSYRDSGVELRYTGLIDLDEKGSLHEFGVEYEIKEDVKVTGVVNKIFADNSIPNNQFTAMEDFSHVRIELRYFY